MIGIEHALTPRVLRGSMAAEPMAQWLYESNGKRMPGEQDRFADELNKLAESELDADQRRQVEAAIRRDHEVSMSHLRSALRAAAIRGVSHMRRVILLRYREVSK